MKPMKKSFLLGLGLAFLIFSNYDLFFEKLYAEEITSNRAESGRISNSKAEKIIETWFFDGDKHFRLINKDQKFPVREVTPREVWEGLKGQVFVVDEKQNLQMNAGDTFLIKDMKVYHLGFNVKEYCVADLNKDGKQDLIFVRSVPGDVCFSADLGVFIESLSGSKVFGPKYYYSCGDFHLKKINDQSVEVDVQNEDSFTFAKGSIFPLGRVGILHRNGQMECVINFYPNLPPKTMDRFH